MGMVPIPVIPASTLSRWDEPVLEPPLPISRVHEQSSNTRSPSEDGYSPSKRDPHPIQVPHSTEVEATPASTDSRHNVNVFA